MKIGVYVGSFNPVHKGHMAIINHLKNKKYLDKVIIIPTGNYWDKQDLVDINHRINMLKIYQNDYLIVNDTLNHLPYTYEILNELKNEYPRDELYLIIGDDNLQKFHLWKNIQEILKNNVLVIPRNTSNCKQIINQFPEKEKFTIVDDFVVIDISSTQIRECIETKDYAKASLYLDYEVLWYIIVNKLYNNFEKALDGKRLVLQKRRSNG